ncbi:hypothetical protein ACFPL7_19990 [Dongia soli]|uniref:Uncharacterized protein n=1 Tax=Dongia soli TaxID=600628 RepID=A0ABU5E7N0_9PROT|nr:hypothetical protein [Dongia soli]MDY0881871.1 hypothetical protein [Dongia soli]
MTKRDSLLARPKFAIPLIAIFLSLAACTSGGQSSSVVSPISANDPSRIDLTVRDPLPVADARLVDPQGNATTAVRIDRNRVNYRRGSGVQPGIGAGAAGGSSSGVTAGVGLGVTIPLFSGGDSDNTVTESRASFRIPDLAAYRKTWQQWKIQVDLSDGSSERSMELQAPAPAD